jgi:hypothetical protein
MSSTEHERFGDKGGSADSGADLWRGESGARPELTRERRAPRSDRTWAYRKAALIHPSNLIALAGILMLGLIHPAASILLFGLGAELLVFYLAPKSRRFRRYLDEGFEAAQQAEAQRAREALIARMTESHRDELTRIEGLIKKIHDIDAGRTEPVALAEDLDLVRITGSYMRLALLYKACEDALSASEYKPLRLLIRSLEAAEKTATERVRGAIRERLAIAYQRAEHEVRVREDLEVYTHQLATLVDWVHLQHQKALSLGPLGEAARFVQELEEERSAARELRELDLGERSPVKPAAPSPATLQVRSELMERA